MASINQWVQSLNISTCKTAWLYLRSNPIEETPQDLLEYRTAIRRGLKVKAEKLKVPQQQVLLDTQEFCRLYLLPKNELEWLKASDKRACYFAQKAIEQTGYDEIFNRVKILNLNFPLDPDFKKIDRFFHTKGFDEHDTSVGKRDYFIDYIHQVKLDKNHKTNIVRYIKEKHRGNVSLCNFSWFKRNQEHDQWLYSYMYEKIYSVYRNHRLDNTISDYYYSAVEIFDMWDGMIDSKKLFIVNLKKAYQQKKFREKKKGKTFAYEMPAKVGKMMDELSDATGLPKNKIIEKLITDEHTKVVVHKGKVTKFPYN